MDPDVTVKQILDLLEQWTSIDDEEAKGANDIGESIVHALGAHNDPIWRQLVANARFGQMIQGAIGGLTAETAAIARNCYSELYHGDARLGVHAITTSIWDAITAWLLKAEQS